MAIKAPAASFKPIASATPVKPVPSSSSNPILTRSLTPPPLPPPPVYKIPQLVVVHTPPSSDGASTPPGYRTPPPMSPPSTPPTPPPGSNEVGAWPEPPRRPRFDPRFFPRRAQSPVSPLSGNHTPPGYRTPPPMSAPTTPPMRRAEILSAEIVLPDYHDPDDVEWARAMEFRHDH